MRSCDPVFPFPSPAEAGVSRGAPPQWRAVDVVPMEDKKRWRELFDRLSKLGELMFYPVAIAM